MKTLPPRQIEKLEGVYAFEISADTCGLRVDFETGEGAEAPNLEELAKKIAKHIAHKEKQS